MVLSVPAIVPAEAPEMKPGTPGAFLLSVVNDPVADPKLRVDAAKALLPYLHQKAAEPSKAAQSDQLAMTAQQGTGWQALLSH